MGISFVGVETAEAVSSSNTSVNVHTNVVDGDVGLLYAHLDDSGATTRTAVLPGAFTEIDNYLKTAGNDQRVAVAYRVASSEPASYAVTSNTADSLGLVLIWYRGVDQTTPIDVTFSSGSHRSESTSGTVGSYAPPAITTVKNNALVVVTDHTSHIHNYTGSGGPSGYTLRVSHTDISTFGGGLVVAEKQVITAGVETPGNWASSASSATQYVNYTVALRPDVRLGKLINGGLIRS